MKSVHLVDGWIIQGGSNMTGTDVARFTHKQSRSYLNLLVLGSISRRWDVGIWTGLGWPRIGTGGGRL